MTFYLEHPLGVAHLKKIRHACLSRLDFFLSLDRHDDEIQLPSEFVCVDTKEDNLSHHILALTMCYCNEFHLFLKWETVLFVQRLNESKPHKWLKLVTAACDHSTQDVQLIRILSSLSKAPHNFTWRKAMSNFFKKKPMTLELPWLCIQQLVSQRKVKLSEGVATVHIEYLPEVLTSIFQMILLVHKERWLLCIRKGEKCICDLADEVKLILRRSYNLLSRPDSIGVSDIEDMCQNFPPCMTLMKKSLGMTRRLPHHNRIRYTLFLKEIGLPVDGALNYFKNFYSVHGNQSSCRHNWSDKMVYNIRHLYGLEGSRVDYSAHQCRALQAVGCCPFTNKDSDNLSVDLKNHCGQKQSKIQVHVGNDEPSEACCVYLGNVDGRCLTFRKPSEFFFIKKDHEKK